MFFKLLFFSFWINEIGPGFQQNWADLYIFINHSFNIGFRVNNHFPP